MNGALEKDFSRAGYQRAGFMPKKTETKTETNSRPATITFEPEDDVAKELSDLLASMGNPWGMRSKVINDVLRDGIRAWKSRLFSALGETKGKKAA
jgi:hypothetical protein